jgi:hypothetical protein
MEGRIPPTKKIIPRKIATILFIIFDDLSDSLNTPVPLLFSFYLDDCLQLYIKISEMWIFFKLENLPDLEENRKP